MNGTHGEVTLKGYSDISKEKWDKIFNDKDKEVEEELKE